MENNPQTIKVDDKELPYKLGDIIDFAEKKDALIVSIEVTISGRISYQLEWFNDGELKKDWFCERELKRLIEIAEKKKIEGFHNG